MAMYSVWGGGGSMKSKPRRSGTPMAFSISTCSTGVRRLGRSLRGVQLRKMGVSVAATHPPNYKGGGGHKGIKA